LRHHLVEPRAQQPILCSGAIAKRQNGGRGEVLRRQGADRQCVRDRSMHPSLHLKLL
jgi:hypothetical protein